jgi:hypothetical protein
MVTRRVNVETLFAPSLYTADQIEIALAVAWLLGRGRFVLVEPPAR